MFFQSSPENIFFFAFREEGVGLERERQKHIIVKEKH